MTAREQGAAALRAGDFASAAGHYDRAVREAPTDAEAWSGLGLALAQSGQPAEGIAALDRAVALEPRNPAYHFQRGAVLERGGRLREAAAAYGEAYRLDPTHVQAWEALARVRHLLSPPPPPAYFPPPYPAGYAAPYGAAAGPGRKDDGTRVALMIGGSVAACVAIFGIGVWSFWAHFFSGASRRATRPDTVYYQPAPWVERPDWPEIRRPRVRTPEIRIPDPPRVRAPEIWVPSPPIVRRAEPEEIVVPAPPRFRHAEPEEIVVPSPPRIRLRGPEEPWRRFPGPRDFPRRPDLPRPRLDSPRFPDFGPDAGGPGSSPPDFGATPL